MGAQAIVQQSLGVIGGAVNLIEGAKAQSDIKNTMDNYERQNLENSNVYKNNQVSTLGADRAIQEQSRLASTQVGALREGGTRAIIGGLGRVEAGNQQVVSNIGANLDQQQANLDMQTSEDDARIRRMIEDRENADLSALSSQYQAAKQQKMMGIGNLIGAGGNIVGSIAGGGATEPQLREATTSNIAPITPAGAIPLSENRAPFAPSIVQGNTMFQSNPFNPMFKRNTMPTAGYGRTIVGYDGSGQPIYN
jgi:hypothetical protein